MTGLDRDKARSVIGRWLIYEARDYDVDQILDALEQCVTPDPAQTIDRDALVMMLFTRDPLQLATYEQIADEVLALLRPDPRIAAIEAVMSDEHWWGMSDHAVRRKIRAILRGKQ